MKKLIFFLSLLTIISTSLSADESFKTVRVAKKAILESETKADAATLYDKAVKQFGKNAAFVDAITTKFGHKPTAAEIEGYLKKGASKGTAEAKKTEESEEGTSATASARKEKPKAPDKDAIPALADEFKKFIDEDVEPFLTKFAKEIKDLRADEKEPIMEKITDPLARASVAFMNEAHPGV